VKATDLFSGSFSTCVCVRVCVRSAINGYTSEAPVKKNYITTYNMLNTRR